VDGVKPAAIFVLRASAKVEAGQPISVEIVRQTHDGRAHDFELKFDPGTLINGAPEKAVRIGDGSEGWKADIATVVNPPGDGPQTLHIYLMPGESGPQIGVPRTVDVVVTRPATFSVRAPDTAVPRGDPVAFTIGRSGGSGQARVTYTVTQGTNLLSKGELVFEENAGPQNVRFTDYDRCAEPLTFELLGAKGQTKATAAFSDECPPPPPPPWVEILKQWWPVALLLPIGWLFWRGTRRVMRRLFPPKIVKGFTFALRRSSFPGGEPRLRLPQIEKRVGVTIGNADCPNPLPLRETIDE
jgi:hypothetical protein